jgi:hypothetical protein
MNRRLFVFALLSIGCTKQKKIKQPEPIPTQNPSVQAPPPAYGNKIVLNQQG